MVLITVDRDYKDFEVAWLCESSSSISGVQRLRRSARGWEDDQQRPLGDLHHRAGAGHGLPQGGQGSSGSSTAAKLTICSSTFEFKSWNRRRSEKRRMLVNQNGTEIKGCQKSNPVAIVKGGTQTASPSIHACRVQFSIRIRTQLLLVLRRARNALESAGLAEGLSLKIWASNARWNDVWMKYGLPFYT